MKHVLILLAALIPAFAQGPEISISQFPAPNPGQLIYAYDGSNNLISACYAKSFQPTSAAISISAASNANPASFTSAGHGFNTNSRPQVIIKGGTGNWTAINGSFTATITGVNTFTIPVDSTALGALTGTITFTTTAPRINQPQWAVYQAMYTGTNLVFRAWLNGSSAFQAKCSDAASTSLNLQ